MNEQMIDLLSGVVIVHFGYGAERWPEFVHGRGGRSGGLTRQRTFWKERKIKHKLNKTEIILHYYCERVE